MSAQILAKICQSNNLVEELSTRAKLEDNEIVLARFRKADKFDNIWVVQLSHYLNFFENIGTLFNTSVSTIPTKTFNGVHNGKNRNGICQTV